MSDRSRSDEIQRLLGFVSDGLITEEEYQAGVQILRGDDCPVRLEVGELRQSIGSAGAIEVTTFGASPEYVVTFSGDRPSGLTADEIYVNLADTAGQIPIEAMTANCRDCQNFHGQSYGGNFLVCGMHPYGLESDCPDFEARSIDPIMQLERELDAENSSIPNRVSFLLAALCPGAEILLTRSSAGIEVAFRRNRRYEGELLRFDVLEINARNGCLSDFLRSVIREIERRFDQQERNSRIEFRPRRDG